MRSGSGKISATLAPRENKNLSAKSSWQYSRETPFLPLPKALLPEAALLVLESSESNSFQEALSQLMTGKTHPFGLLMPVMRYLDSLHQSSPNHQSRGHLLNSKACFSVPLKDRGEKLGHHYKNRSFRFIKRLTNLNLTAPPRLKVG